MAKEPIRDMVLEALEKEAPLHGLDIVDVEVVGVASAPVVRVRIDHADESLPTVTLDEVTRETSWIAEVLDELDPLPGSYSLEVSSPGLDRPLRRAHDFERFAGSNVVVQTTATEGRRHFTGRLLGVSDAGVGLLVDGEQIHMPFSSIKKAKLKPDLSINGKKRGGRN